MTADIDPTIFRITRSKLNEFSLTWATDSYRGDLALHSQFFREKKQTNFPELLTGKEEEEDENFVANSNSVHEESPATAAEDVESIFGRLFNLLPRELLDIIISHVPLSTLYSLRLLNSHWYSLISSHASFRLAISRPIVLYALHRTTFTSYVSLHQINAILRNPYCHTCGKHGDFLYIPTASRCCLICLVSHPWLRTIDVWRAQSTFSLPTSFILKNVPFIVITSFMTNSGASEEEKAEQSREGSSTENQTTSATTTTDDGNTEEITGSSDSSKITRLDKGRSRTPLPLISGRNRPIASNVSDPERPAYVNELDLRRVAAAHGYVLPNPNSNGVTSFHTSSNKAEEPFLNAGTYAGTTAIDVSQDRRYNVCIPLPWIDRRTNHVNHGLYCKGCMYGYLRSEPNDPDSLERKLTWRTRRDTCFADGEEMEAHLKRCGGVREILRIARQRGLGVRQVMSLARDGRSKEGEVVMFDVPSGEQLEIVDDDEGSVDRGGERRVDTIGEIWRYL